MEFAGLIEGPFRVAKQALIEALKITHEALSRGRWRIDIGRAPSLPNRAAILGNGI